MVVTSSKRTQFWFHVSWSFVVFLEKLPQKIASFPCLVSKGAPRKPAMSVCLLLIHVPTSHLHGTWQSVTTLFFSTLHSQSSPLEFWPFFLSCDWLSWPQKPCPPPPPCCTKDFLSLFSPPHITVQAVLTTFFLNPLWAFQRFPYQPILHKSCNTSRLYHPQNKTSIFTTPHTSLCFKTLF